MQSDQCQRGSRSPNGDRGAPMGINEHLLYQRRTMGGGGGYEAAPPCVIDECNGFASNSIYYRRRTNLP